MGQIDDLADRYVEDWARLSPVGAPYVGIAGHDHLTDDLSPDGFAAQASYPVEVDEEIERLEDHRDQHEAGGLQYMT